MQPKHHIIKQVQFDEGVYAIRPPKAPLPAAPVEDHMAAAREQAAMEAQSQAMALLAEAQRQAEQLLADAQAQASALREAALREAHEEAERVREAARAEGEAEGLAAGRVQGHEAVLQEAGALLEGLQQGIERGLAERSHWLESQERELLNLALMIAQKVLCLELAHSRDAAVAMVEEALRHLTDKSQVRVRVHPMDLQRVVAAKGRLNLAVDGLKHLEIVADPKVGLAGCLVDTRTGVVDARLATQLAEIAAGLLELAPGPEGAEGLHPMVLAAITALGEGGHVLAEAQAQAQAHLNTQATLPPPPAAPVVAPAPAPAPPSEAAPVATPEPAEAAASMEEGTASAEAEAAKGPTGEGLALALEATEEAFREAVDEAIAEALGPGEGLELSDALEEAWIDAEAQASAPDAQEGPEPPPPAPHQDPSVRAAEALAWRLGQLKRGRGVATLSEELQVKLEEGRSLDDQDLAELVRKVSMGPQVDIGLDQVLVHNPNAMEEAAEQLRERLGQKPKGGRAAPKLPPPSAREAEELSRALGDEAIERILGAAGVRPAGHDDPPAAAEAPPAPDLVDASELLAERLGKKTRKPKVRELKPEESAARSEALDAALGDEAIDAIMGAAHAGGAKAAPTEGEADHLEQASDQLSRLLGQPKKRRGRPWYET